MSTTKTTSSTTTSPSHSTFIFPRPLSPTKESLRPNAHPYPIKTTSTALLSRSNSSSSPHHQHHYVPSPPPAAANGGSPKRHGHGHGHRHRYSSSLSSENLPRPLPVPPSPSDGDPGIIVLDSPERKRGKRSETLPSFYSPGAPVALEDLNLPQNPKLWTPSQLSNYLSTALRVKNGDTTQLPDALTRDIAGFVRESKISGKAFLRLDEGDLEGYGVNKLWRTALLTASRNLRQNIFKGQIWAAGSPTSADGSYFPSTPPKEDGEDDDLTPHRRRRSNSQPDSISKARQSRFFHHGGSTRNGTSNGLPGYSSGSSASSSLEDLFASSHRTISPLTASAGSRLSPKSRGEKMTYGQDGRYRNGRVKGMVDTFERSASFDEDDMEEGELKGTRKLLREIRGMREGEVEEVRRVRRERSQSQSGSESGASSLSSGGREGSPAESDDLSMMLEKALKENEVFVEEPGEEERALDDEPKYDVSTVTPAHTGSSTSSSRPLPVPPLHASLRSSPPRSVGEEQDPEAGEEPTIEQLLAREAEKDSLAHPGRHSLTRVQAAKLAQFAHPTKSISKGTGRARKRVGVYAWEDEEAGEGEAVGKVTVKRVPLDAGGLTEVVAPVPMVGGVKEIFKGEGEVQVEGGSRTGTPSSRPLPTPPVHPSLRTFVDVDEAQQEDVAEEEAEETRDGEAKNENFEEQEEETEQEKILRASIEHTKTVLEEFESRLGVVEKKVEVLEKEVGDLSEAKLRQEKETEKAVPSTFAPASTSAPVWPVPIIRKLLDGIFRDSSTDATASESESAVDKTRQGPRNRLLSLLDPDPQRISQLPPYVILVGLGVCAVVLRVVARRLGARR